MTPDERSALAAFVSGVRRHYGPRLVDLFVFGSRARGDATEDSDVDLAIILQDGDWKFWTEKLILADLMHDALVEQGLYIQAWPVRQSEWVDPVKHSNPRFVEAMKRDARPWAEAA